MKLRETKPWLNEDDKPYFQQSCRKCVYVLESGRHDDRRSCLHISHPEGIASSPCPKFERSDLTEEEILSGIGKKIEGRPDSVTPAKSEMRIWWKESK